MLNLRSLAVLTAGGIVALGLGASATGITLKSRIDAATSDLTKVQAPIPHADLHRRALEILQERADAVKAAAAADDRCGAPADFIGPVLCPTDAPVVAESVPLPRPDPRKAGVQ